ncbi:hypothetical protein O3G_MSEX001301 [Manduca sexta]|uniref:Nucleoprotein n=1 Tax=Manduca sexta TaxID=7130 RepID=A0A922CBP6_MANSE|nr:hypothetical protein O3G_MSEX001301 [Manduca sexta]
MSENSSLKKIHDDFENMMKSWEDAEELKKLYLPRANAAKKSKFLKAIGATCQLDEATTNANMDDENLHLTVTNTTMHMITRMVQSNSIKPEPFDDSIVINGFRKIKRPKFDLKTYISCVKGLYNNILLPSTDICYLLCHARDFTVPRNHLFKFSETGTDEIKSWSTDFTGTVSSPSPFTAKLMTLIDDLLVKYSEAKYQQLNLNVTYLVLVLSRKFFKNKSSYMNALMKQKTHEDYVKLCPKPLDERLPNDDSLLNHDVIIQGNTLFMLILYAYQQSSRLTRRVLVTTCIMHMEYTGLGLPKMFDKLVLLYRVPEAQLWDAFCEYDYESLFKLADFHDVQRKGEEEEPPKTYSLFPYCRLLGQNYHSDLSCKENQVLCYAMACLIDKKIGTNKSHLREAYWVKEIKNTKIITKGNSLADAAYEKIKVYDDCNRGGAGGQVNC